MPGLPSPRDAEFWTGWYQGDEQRPPGWDQAGAAERCVLAHADMLAWLGEVIPFYLGGETAAGLWRWGEDRVAIRALIPEFAAIVTALTASGRTEVRRAATAAQTFEEAAPLTAAELTAALADPAAWLRPEGRLLIIGPGERGLSVAIRGA
jgi:hypothetical protein